jgi:hypothetical protein
MLSFSGSLKVFVAVEACDLRKGFNGLHGFANRRHGTIALAGGNPFFHSGLDILHASLDFLVPGCFQLWGGVIINALDDSFGQPYT